MKTILNKLINHEVLSKEEAKNVLINISSGQYNPSQISAFLTVFMMRSITIDELSGFREALLELCIRIDLSAYNTIDLCGTGGDGKDTFNISTLASFVAAGAGIKVAKHGNYGVSSISGSSNVMEKMGIKFSNDPSFLEKCIDQAGICVLHAPLFHPAMKNVGPIRKELAVKTFFNMLGPMVNPSFPQNQLVGVFNLELARMYAYLYQNTNVNFTILHSLDGYDEISLTGPTKIITSHMEGMIKPEDFGIRLLSQTEIEGGKTIEESAEIFTNIISGKGNEAQNNVVCANAAMAIATVTKCSPQEGFELAKESLFSGKGLKALQKLQELSL
ncbi:anthranilate phosphoribosyltransferase [Flavobacterium johnsoniae]|jgi:anthranilate phosphoribosyltransferase|uniref:Anthranilate phosphoribosyltransferase n=1 Tax=Flavobacterium johnsoniae (strain ATCC 17061 / DSM 2064 / JCM 8514 / BCRC 14874 / CCUG 350202 / NBRC 14942 / NCIMB 11054 / UW101) TaxID=376686 RepID=TRPD_FLAJ1|nr:anthranilate phosphoribosyltransferase [Flavobacterium johnsoniae]A5FA70.1 RecName: Full=Anthranilate phosphoribosyltransferase [Flavobacterium johnsoniae UW101]ABQ07892.1 anthranilate phosphoribosyltransferase [Flavobacterium johnsoniae UW101]OXG01973.1 anthranilate phosphoribosyltransferase [Flavobacterium johnsoniae UW101]WQG80264.1 anthranilate phosphoribosyltransferase [Flavobacterium johnsoniae UW101]SHK98644.1 anthranilate phosphoribosyltransferase [Flavobacterium johnsoniae]